MNLLTKAVLLIVLFTPFTSFGGEADVVRAEATVNGEGVYSFSVTVKHDDEGWDHYADRWEVLTPEGKLLGSRVLMHPHVGEQPFTRSLYGVDIPPGVEEVLVRAHDSVHEFGGKTFILKLTDTP